MPLKIDLEEEVADRLEKKADVDRVSVEELANQVLSNFSRELGEGEKTDHGPWSNEKNERRCQLIDKQITGEISDVEKSEVMHLQEELREHLDQETPFDLDTARQVHRELIKR